MFYCGKIIFCAHSILEKSFLKFVNAKIEKIRLGNIILSIFDFHFAKTKFSILVQQKLVIWIFRYTITTKKLFWHNEKNLILNYHVDIIGKSHFGINIHKCVFCTINKIDKIDDFPENGRLPICRSFKYYYFYHPSCLNY